MLDPVDATRRTSIMSSCKQPFAAKSKHTVVKPERVTTSAVNPLNARAERHTKTRQVSCDR